MINGDLVNMLDLLPSEELYEIENYIYNLRLQRKQEIIQEKIKQFKILWDEIVDLGVEIKLKDDYETYYAESSLLKDDVNFEY